MTLAVFYIELGIRTKMKVLEHENFNEISDYIVADLQPVPSFANNILFLEQHNKLHRHS